MIDRRQFLKKTGMLTAGSVAGFPQLSHAFAVESSRALKLRIEPVTVDLGPRTQIHTFGYNGSAPGPILRMSEGSPVRVDVTNATKHEELVHWHGLHIPSVVDGSEEEGTPMIPPGQSRSYNFIPSPTGSRWYHTHTMAHRNLERAAYTGQFGFLYIEPKNDAGNYDHEVFLAAHHWEPSFTEMDDTWQNCPEISYRYASFNDKMLGAGAPLRVKKGQRVLFHFLNASATEEITIALPRHKFKVLALDGNAVANPADVEVISLAVAERVDAIVEMNEPGKWILGSVSDDERKKGLGLVVEYSEATGSSLWEPPASLDWHYSLFSSGDHASPEPDEHLEMIFEKKAGRRGEMDMWTINGASFPEIAPLRVKKDSRYRLRLVNASGCAHPIHLHRHTFELKRVAEIPVAGIYKDTVNLPRYSVVDIELVANQPGPTLFHCHQQLHMDTGFMQMLEYV